MRQDAELNKRETVSSRSSSKRAFRNVARNKGSVVSKLPHRRGTR